jgi:hypothetical protein
MTVPLDRLYNFLDDLVDQDIVIYRWWPHGSKLLQNLKPLKPAQPIDLFTKPIVVGHDQEPLDYFNYDENDVINTLLQKRKLIFVDKSDEFHINLIKKKNHCVNYMHEYVNSFNIHDKYILLHSEKNSTEIDNYVKFGALPVYYFSHALISKDWFRYAKVDPSLNKKNIFKDFLVYQRAWSGTREYRLKFSEMLVTSQLYKNCQTSFNFFNEDNTHYSKHKYKNVQFKIDQQLENYYDNNTHDSSSSADYNSDDYNQTGIEVVLETLFDDQRWHLTEKTFRPIVCGQPFILASTPGSLEYLKSYGFKTFSEYINEDYDNEIDPTLRLEKIINTMKTISELSTYDKNILFKNLQTIAEFNKKLFFSKLFYKKIVSEYTDNMKKALIDIKKSMGNCMQLRYKTTITTMGRGVVSNDMYRFLMSKI